MRIYWLRGELNNLGMMARPRGGDWLEDEMIRLKQLGVNILVSLLESHEQFDLDIQDEELICTQLGIQYMNFPIADRNVPNDRIEYMKLVSLLNDKLETGFKVVVHCRMGIGRTSIVCGGILLLNGYKTKGALEFLSATRTLEVPDTLEQVSWLKEIENDL